MDVQTQAAAALPEAPDTPAVAEGSKALGSLGFPEIDRMLARHAETADGRVRPWSRWSLPVGFIGVLVGLSGGFLFSGRAGMWLAISGLGIEVAGVGIWIVLQLKGLWRQVAHARADHAEQLERDYDECRAMQKQLRAFPRDQREARLRYIRNRRIVMQERMGLFSGSMEKLGVLPVLLALYLQFKDWRWGNWQALADVTATQACLAFLLLLGYALSWQLVHLRIRMQSCEFLLEESCRED